MWWLLLIAVSDFEYEAKSVYATQEECALEIDNSLDVCVAAELKIIKLPPQSVIITSELPPVNEPVLTLPEIPFAE